VNIAVVDDKEEDLTRYATGIQEAFRMSKSLQLYKFNNVRMLWNVIEEIDILFLDVQMPQKDGITFAKEIREKKINVIIVFLSDYDSYVWDSFQVDAIYFMRKRYFDKEIGILSEKLMGLYVERSKQKITLVDRKRIFHLDANEIYYIEAQGKQVYIYTKDEVYKINRKFADVEKEFLSLHFMKIHRSYVVNCKYVKKNEKNLIEVEDEKMLPVSKNRSDDVKKLYFSYLGR